MDVSLELMSPSLAPFLPLFLPPFLLLSLKSINKINKHTLKRRVLAKGKMSLGQMAKLDS